jgi:hypothetical protein
MSSVAYQPPEASARADANAGFHTFMPSRDASKSGRKAPRSGKSRVRVAVESDRMEKRAEAFLKLGRQLSAVRTPLPLSSP